MVAKGQTYLNKPAKVYVYFNIQNLLLPTGMRVVKGRTVKEKMYFGKKIFVLM